MIDNKRIREEILEQPVQGINLSQGTLRNQLSDQPTLVVFLRHFG